MKLISSFIVLIFINSTASAATTKYLSTTGQVKFLAIGKPGFLKIKGESQGKSPTGDILVENNAATGQMSFSLNHLTTGLGLRDQHMKEKYLEIQKFPEASLKILPISISETDLKNKIKKSFTGQLNLHGITKDISGQFTFDSQTKEVSAAFKIVLSDFGIDIPEYLGVTVSETVEIDVQLLLSEVKG